MLPRKLCHYDMSAAHMAARHFYGPSRSIAHIGQLAVWVAMNRGVMEHLTEEICARAVVAEVARR